MLYLVHLRLGIWVIKKRASQVSSLKSVSPLTNSLSCLRMWQNFPQLWTFDSTAEKKKNIIFFFILPLFLFVETTFTSAFQLPILALAPYIGILGDPGVVSRVGRKGGTFIAHFLPTRLTDPGSPRMRTLAESLSNSSRLRLISFKNPKC